jgi:predicted transcriptional regulator
MLDVLLGSKNRERVLQYIFVHGEGYAKEIATFYESSLDPIQKQLERLEFAGVFVHQKVGRTKLFMVNPRYAFKNQLEALLAEARKYYDPEEFKGL